MKQTDIIRLGIIAVSLLLAYRGIIYLIEFIDFLFARIATSGGDKPDGSGGFRFLLKILCFFIASYLLIKNSRKISNFIDEQK